MVADWKTELAELIGPEAPERPSSTDRVESLARGEVAAAVLDGAPVAIAHLGDGRIVAVADACPHDGGLLSAGFLDGDNLVCPRHGWEINLRSGACANRRDAPCAIVELRGADRPGPADCQED